MQTAIFASSLGWKEGSGPIFSQRAEPYWTMPKLGTSTSTSATTVKSSRYRETFCQRW